MRLPKKQAHADRNPSSFLLLISSFILSKMSRPASEHYDLPEQEKRDLIKLIEQGKPLPDKYRFVLFADKREVELVWHVPKALQELALSFNGFKQP